MKKDLLERKKDLCNRSMNLRTIKFNINLKREQITKLIEEQNNAYQQFNFYKEYIKAIEKERKR